MFTKTFLIDAAERAAKTAAQNVLLFWGLADGLFNILQINLWETLGIALGGAVLSLLTSVISSRVGDTGSASLVVDTKEIK